MVSFHYTHLSDPTWITFTFPWTKLPSRITRNTRQLNSLSLLCLDNRLQVLSLCQQIYSCNCFKEQLFKIHNLSIQVCYLTYERRHKVCFGPKVQPQLMLHIELISNRTACIYTKAKLTILSELHYDKLMCHAHAGLNFNIQFMEPIRPQPHKTITHNRDYLWFPYSQ